jgi:membrane protein
VRAQGDPLTLGMVFAVYFASSGIESLRIGLNRAYGVSETRRWWRLRLQSSFYVIVSATALLVLAVLIVLGPVITAVVTPYVPWMAQSQFTVTLARFSVATFILTAALFLAHNWLPDGRRRFTEIIPGVAITVALWLVAGAAFGRYLAAFPKSYVLTYAGLASVMIAPVFLYYSSAIFLLGGEINATILRARRQVIDSEPTSSREA